VPRAVPESPGPAEKKGVRPARAPVTDRPLWKWPAQEQRLRHSTSGGQAPAAAPARSQAEIDALVTEHLALASFAVNAVAARISLPAHVSREDLLSCAHVALVEVAKRFDPGAGASFATYALARLQGAVLDELRSGDWASRSVRAAARRTDAAADALTISLGRPPTREELAASLGVPRSELDHLQVDVHRAIMISMDAESGADGASLDLPDTGESPERAVLRGERARYLQDAIRALPDRLDEVVERNFFGDESLTDIAEDLGVTLSRVSQMRARALTLLHAAMSELWEGKAVPPDGGVRARNQQKSYVERVAGRVPAAPSPLPRPRDGWPVTARAAARTA
jgi:RNA polymerase sigma factor for flagellar operon FliA